MRRTRTCGNGGQRAARGKGGNGGGRARMRFVEIPLRLSAALGGRDAERFASPRVEALASANDGFGRRPGVFVTTELPARERRINSRPSMRATRVPWPGAGRSPLAAASRPRPIGVQVVVERAGGEVAEFVADIRNRAFAVRHEVPGVAQLLRSHHARVPALSSARPGAGRDTRCQLERLARIGLRPGTGPERGERSAVDVLEESHVARPDRST